MNSSKIPRGWTEHEVLMEGTQVVEELVDVTEVSVVVLEVEDRDVDVDELDVLDDRVVELSVGETVPTSEGEGDPEPCRAKLA